jgi:amino acid transporter
MTDSSVAVAALDVRTETQKLKRGLTLAPLVGIMYFTVCGGTFGVESLFGNDGSGPGLGLLLLFVVPLIFSVPLMLMVHEMNSMMPHEGGYYHWLKQAFGPFAGFLGGWMNLVVSWLDASIYPVLGAVYLAFIFPALNDGMTVFGVELSGTTVSFLGGALLIWLITALQARGVRLTGLTTNWIGLIILVPLGAMTILGIANALGHGAPSLPFLPGGQEVNGSSLSGAFGLGLFVVMWNYMGFELATVAGDEIVKPKRTYPLAMLIVLILAIATYVLPVLAGLYGGAGADGRYALWGVEAGDGQTIGAVMNDAGIDTPTLEGWGVDPEGTSGWYLPDIAKAVGDNAAGAVGSDLGNVLGNAMTIAAALSMIGLFIGNSLGASRVPFALAEDGMMPRWLVKVSPRYGTPWVAIAVAGVFYTIFATNAFAFLVVADVLLNALVIVACFFAVWRLRVTRPELTRPELHRQRIPGGWPGLIVATAGPVAVLSIAIYSQINDVGSDAVTLSLAAIVVGAILYIPLRMFTKPGVPDVDPYHEEAITAEVPVPAPIHAPRPV